MAGGIDRKRGLGRGLSALMSDVAETEQTASAGAASADRSVPIEQVSPNPDQPRKRFADEDLDDLTASIQEKGIIQPLIVRTVGRDAYEIVAGERRWRAAQIANLLLVPIAHAARCFCAGLNPRHHAFHLSAAT